MDKSYRVIKLASGEELIGKIKGQVGNKMVIERPMIFRSAYTFDPLGNQKEVTFLKNWLVFSDQIQTNIPMNHIVTILEPDKDVISLYDREMEREDTKDSKFNLTGMSDMAENQKKAMQDFMKDVDAMSAEMEETQDYLKKFGFDPDQVSNIMDQFFGGEEEMDEEDFVHLNISFDPSILKKLVDNDILPPEYLMKLIEKFEKRETISDEFTGDETDRKDFGNKWSDWNSDPNSEDYK